MEQLLELLILKSNGKCTNNAGTRQLSGFNLGISLYSSSHGFALLKFCVTTCRVLIPLTVLIADRINERPILLIWYFTIYGFEYVADKFPPLFMRNFPMNPPPVCLKKLKAPFDFGVICLLQNRQIPNSLLLLLLWLYVVIIVVHYFVFIVVHALLRCRNCCPLLRKLPFLPSTRANDVHYFAFTIVVHHYVNFVFSLELASTTFLL